MLAEGLESIWFFSRPLEWGTLIEWLGAEGSGAATLALVLAANVVREEGAFIVIDSRGEFYPPAAANLGIPLERSVIVRPGNNADALWALEQSLRSGAAAVVLAWMGSVPDAALRRLQLAAETGGSLGFLLRPISCRAEPSWAQLRLLVGRGGDKETRRQGEGEKGANCLSPPLLVSLSPPLPLSLSPCLPLSPSSSSRRLRVEVLHCRGGTGGEIVELELSDETGHVHLAPRLGHSTLSTGAAGA